MTNRLETILALADENPTEPMPQLMAGNDLLNSGEPARALEYLRRHVELLPGGDVGAALRMMARAHAALGEEAPARETFHRAIEAALAHGHGDLAATIREEIGGG